MEKIKKTKTVYLAIEVLAGSPGKASEKAIDMMKHLYNEGFVENYEIFLADDHSINETKKFISAILFEVMKLKSFTDKAFITFNSYIKLFNDIVNQAIKK